MQQKSRGRPKKLDKLIIKTIKIKPITMEFLKTTGNANGFINFLIENTPQYKNFISTRTEIKN